MASPSSVLKFPIKLQRHLVPIGEVDLKLICCLLVTQQVHIMPCSSGISRWFAVR